MKKEKIIVSGCKISENGVVLPLNFWGRLYCNMGVVDGVLVKYKLGTFKLKD